MTINEIMAKISTRPDKLANKDSAITEIMIIMNLSQVNNGSKSKKAKKTAKGKNRGVKSSVGKCKRGGATKRHRSKQNLYNGVKISPSHT